MGLSGAKGVGRDFPTEYDIPNYERYSRRVAHDETGRRLHTFAHSQRFEYINLNVTGRLHNYEGPVELLNTVTTSKISAPEQLPPQVTEQRGGLYFEHGYDAYKPTDILAASGYENVDMDEVASTLINNESFELKITAHADTSGDVGKNQTLSENRLQTAQTLLVAALERQGLSHEDAQKLYDDRVAPHASIIAQGESNGPVQTGDETRHQGNRVVTFDLITQQPQEMLEGTIRKGVDPDNHEHLVVVNMGTTKRRSDIDLIPEDVGRRGANKFGIADEDVKFIFRIDPRRQLNEQHQFTVNFWPRTNEVADNTTFLIETNEPGAVTSRYNFDTQKVEISINGQVAVNVGFRNTIDPARIRVGQVSSNGHVTVSPLTNLADVQPLSEARQTATESNPLTIAADRIVQLTIEAKHLFMEHERDAAGYQAALQESGFSQKVHEALQDLEGRGIATGPLERLLVSQYANPESELYSPDQLFFPFQTYQALYQGQRAAGNIAEVEPDQAFDALSELLESIAQVEDTSTGPQAVPRLEHPPR